MKRYDLDNHGDDFYMSEAPDGVYVEFDKIGPQLTPEHRERIRRIAIATGRTEEQVLSDAVTELWARFACRGQLGPGQW